MKKSISFLLSVFSVMCGYSQVFTFDFYSHTSYVNNEPGQVILLNENWEEKIDYIGSGNDYHMKYVFDMDNSTLTTYTSNENGTLNEEYHSFEDIFIHSVGDDHFLVFNPYSEMFNMFYIDDNGVPFLVVESINGEGFFTTNNEFTYTVD